MPGDIKTYINYSKGDQQDHFITVLPDYKIILEVSLKEGSAKVVNHENYREQGVSEVSELVRVFGKNRQLEEFTSWKNFLLVNFLRPYRKDIYMSQNGNVDYSDIFIGINHNGLGIKLMENFKISNLKSQDKS